MELAKPIEEKKTCPPKSMILIIEDSDLLVFGLKTMIFHLEPSINPLVLSISRLPTEQEIQNAAVIIANQEIWKPSPGGLPPDTLSKLILYSLRAHEENVASTIRLVNALSTDFKRVVATFLKMRNRELGERNRGLLTSRENEILRRLISGDRNKEIASHLNISVRTVETHRRNIMKKVEAKSFADLIVYAVSNGLTPTSL